MANKKDALRLNGGKPEYWLVPPYLLALDTAKLTVSTSFLMLDRFLQARNPEELKKLFLYIESLRGLETNRSWHNGLELAARVLRAGVGKYPIHNWQKGGDWSVPYASLVRHLVAYDAGEQTDAETKLPHLWHVLCNIMMLLHYMRVSPHRDDLPLSASAMVEPVEDGNDPTGEADGEAPE